LAVRPVEQPADLLSPRIEGGDGLCDALLGQARLAIDPKRLHLGAIALRIECLPKPRDTKLAAESRFAVDPEVTFFRDVAEGIVVVPDDRSAVGEPHRLAVKPEERPLGFTAMLVISPNRASLSLAGERRLAVEAEHPRILLVAFGVIGYPDIGKSVFVHR